MNEETYSQGGALQEQVGATKLNRCPHNPWLRLIGEKAATVEEEEELRSRAAKGKRSLQCSPTHLHAQRGNRY